MSETKSNVQLCQYRKGYPEGPDYCKLNESICDLEIGGECPESEPD